MLPRTKAEVKTSEEPWMRLVQRNLPLVKYVLGKVSRNLPPCVDRDDLLAAGSLGLTEAARRYDPGRNVPFHSYAIPRIWGAMLDELRGRDWLPADVRGRVKQLRQRQEDARQLGQAAPTIEELAEAFGCVSGDLDRLLAISKSGQRKNSQELMSAESAVVTARLGVRAPRGPYEEAEFCDQKRLLAAAIQNLPERERQVVVLRYHEDLLLHEIGKVLDVTESRVCQIHTEALRRLKRALSRAGLGVNA